VRLLGSCLSRAWDRRFCSRAAARGCRLRRGDEYAIARRAHRARLAIPRRRQRAIPSAFRTTAAPPPLLERPSEKHRQRSGQRRRSFVSWIRKVQGQGFAGTRGPQSGQRRENQDRRVEKAFLFARQGSEGRLEHLNTNPKLIAPRDPCGSPVFLPGIVFGRWIRQGSLILRMLLKRATPSFTVEYR
jgi:hypothetical protein